MAKRKPGRYDAIVPGLPELPTDASRQEKLDLFKQLFLESFRKGHDGRAPSATDLVKKYTDARKQQAELSEQWDANGIAIEALTQMMVESNNRQEEGWGAYGAAPNTLLLANGDRVRLDVEPYPTVVDKDAAREWAIAEGLGRMLMLWPSTLASLVKKRLLNGEGDPPGVKSFKKKKVVYTEAKAVTAEDDAPEWSPDDDVAEPQIEQPF